MNRRGFLGISLSGVSAWVGKAAGVSGALAAMPLNAQSTQAYSFVVTQAPGSSHDILARNLNPRVAELLGRSVVVENRQGASGIIGMTYGARAKADGQTITMVSGSTLGITPLIQKDINYKPADFVLVGVLGATPNVLAVSAKATYEHTLDGLVSHARKTGQPLRYGSPGYGTTQHLEAVLLARQTGLTFDHITYRGPVDCLQALVNGDIDFAFNTAPSTVALTQAGKIVPIAITNRIATPSLAAIPSFKEQGYPEFDQTDVWLGAGVPRATPAAVVEELTSTFSRVYADDTLRSHISGLGFLIPPSRNRAELDGYLDHQLVFWASLVESANLTVTS